MKLKLPKITKKSLARAMVSPDPLTQAAATKFLKSKNLKVKVSGDESDFLAEPAIQRYAADNRVKIGLSLSSVKKAAKKVVKSKAVNPIAQTKMAVSAVKKAAPVAAKIAPKIAPAVSKLAAAAKVVGPAVSTIYPPAGIAISAAGAVLNKAASGDNAALAKLKTIADGVKAGLPQAVQQQGILDIAKNAAKNVQANALLAAKKLGDVKATEQIEAIKEGAANGIESAKQAYETLTNANLGNVLPKPGEVVDQSQKAALALSGLTQKQMALIGGGVLAATVGFLVIRRK